MDERKVEKYILKYLQAFDEGLAEQTRVAKLMWEKIDFKLMTDKSFLLNLVKEYPLIFHLIPREFMVDEAFVFQAVQSNMIIWAYVPDELRFNRKFVNKVLQVRPLIEAISGATLDERIDDFRLAWVKMIRSRQFVPDELQK